MGHFETEICSQTCCSYSSPPSLRLLSCLSTCWASTSSRPVRVFPTSCTISESTGSQERLPALSTQQLQTETWAETRWASTLPPPSSPPPLTLSLESPSMRRLEMEPKLGQPLLSMAIL